ncbi:MAG: hypothetical protein FWC70_01250 [Defluviitaleaceae bacterium]|nr:hypothetical protein [Defluviitaleaceae bacterium]
MSAQGIDVHVTIRVNKDLKEAADSLFERLGLNMDVVFNMFLHEAINADAGFGNGISADCVTNAFNVAVAGNIKENRQKGLPIAGYDAEKKLAYLEFADGTKEYVRG